MTEEAPGGRIFFSSTGRTFGEEDELCVLSVGVDIGSSTSHLVFSRIVLERLDSRYVVTERESFYQSDILLTPYSAADTIDSDALGAFFKQQYKDAKVDPDEIDTGALILTGVAVRRSNARRIGELFAAQAGKMVAVSAGDSMETVMAAYGSGAAARSIRSGAPLMKVHIGGGTPKIPGSAHGKVIDVPGVDVGARFVVPDDERRIVRLEEAGRRFGAELGMKLEPGVVLSEPDAQALAARMADGLFEAMRGGSPRAGGAELLRLDPLGWRGEVSDVSFSGGVSEYIYGGEARAFGDIGPQLAAEVRARLRDWGPQLARPDARIRATVIGASQYTMQVSGSTIFVSPLETLPLRNVPVIAPTLPLGDDKIDAAAIAAAIKAALKRLDLGDGASAVAVFVPWRGSATFQRLDDFCKGIADGLAAVLANGHPIVLAGDGDVGGLIGLHHFEEMKLKNPIVSIDGLELKEFDYIDIGAILDTSGAVPVVIKSLIFPTSAGLGKDWEAERPEAPVAVAAK